MIRKEVALKKRRTYGTIYIRDTEHIVTQRELVYTVFDFLNDCAASFTFLVGAVTFIRVNLDGPFFRKSPGSYQGNQENEVRAQEGWEGERVENPVVEAPPPPPKTPKCPWSEHWDPNHKQLYYEHLDGRSQWEVPEGYWKNDA